MNLTNVYPQEKLVTIGEVGYLVGPFALADLAALQGALEGAMPHPLDAHRAEVESLDGEARLDLLRECWREAESYPPTWGDEASHAYTCSIKGISGFLMIALNKHQDVSAESVAEMVWSISYPELAALYRICYGHEAHRELERMLEGEPEPDAAPVPWCQLIDEVSRTHGWTYDYIGTLTLSQFAVALNGGKDEKRYLAETGSLEDALRIAADRRQKLYGEVG